MLLSIDEIQARINDLGSRINIPSRDLHIFPVPQGDGTPYISFDNDEYNYVYSERGVELLRRKTQSLDELLYWIMYDFIHTIAINYELAHRDPCKDGRRIIFPKIIELMNKIEPAWGSRVEKRLGEILIENPYRDD